MKKNLYKKTGNARLSLKAGIYFIIFVLLKNKRLNYGCYISKLIKTNDIDSIYTIEYIQHKTILSTHYGPLPYFCS